MSALSPPSVGSRASPPTAVAEGAEFFAAQGAKLSEDAAGTPGPSVGVKTRPNPLLCCFLKLGTF